MAYIRGESRELVTLFPITLDELIRATTSVGDRRFCESVADTGVGVCACGTGGDRAAGLRSARFAEAVPVRIYEPGALVAAAGS